MGCATSSPQAAHDGTSGTLPPLTGQGSGNGSPVNGVTNGDSAAAVVEGWGKGGQALGGAAADLAGAPVLDAIITAVDMIGTGLLKVAQHCPYAAPVAYALASVAAACRTAHVLKGDCHSFLEVLEVVERALCAASDLDGQRQCLDLVSGCLDRAMVLVHKLQKRGAIAAVVMAFGDAVEFSSITRELHQALATLTFTASLDTNALLRIKFQQSEQLSEAVARRGGAAAVVADPNALAEVEGLLSGGERLILAAVQAESSKVAKKVDAVADSVGTLVVTNQAVAYDTALIKMQSQVLEARLNEVQCMLNSQQQMLMSSYMRQFPLPADEPRRLLVMSRYGVMRSKVTPAITEAVNTANREFKDTLVGMGVYLADGHHVRRMLHVWRAEYVKGPQADDPQALEAVPQCMMARKLTVCQHTLMKPPGQLTELSMCEWSDVVFKPDAAYNVADADPAVAMQRDILSNPDSAEAKTIDLRKGALGTALASITVDYLGAPVAIDGCNVGGLCLFYRRDRGCSPAQRDALRTVANVVSSEIVRQAEEELQDS